MFLCYQKGMSLCHSSLTPFGRLDAPRSLTLPYKPAVLKMSNTSQRFSGSPESGLTKSISKFSLSFRIFAPLAHKAHSHIHNGERSRTVNGRSIRAHARFAHLPTSPSDLLFSTCRSSSADQIQFIDPIARSFLPTDLDLVRVAGILSA